MFATSICSLLFSSTDWQHAIILGCRGLDTPGCCQITQDVMGYVAHQHPSNSVRAGQTHPSFTQCHFRALTFPLRPMLYLGWFCSFTFHSAFSFKPLQNSSADASLSLQLTQLCWIWIESLRCHLYAWLYKSLITRLALHKFSWSRPGFVSWAALQADADSVCLDQSWAWN